MPHLFNPHAISPDALDWALETAREELANNLRDNLPALYGKEWPEVATLRARYCSEIAHAAIAQGAASEWMELAVEYADSMYGGPNIGPTRVETGGYAAEAIEDAADYRAPLEVTGVREVKEGAHYHCERDTANPEFFAVYARHTDNRAVCIGDFRTREMAEHYKAVLEPILIDCGMQPVPNTTK